MSMHQNVTINEACGLIPCSRGSIYKRFKEKQLTPLKFGSRTMINREELLEYMALNGRSVVAQIVAQDLGGKTNALKTLDKRGKIGAGETHRPIVHACLQTFNNVHYLQ